MVKKESYGMAVLSPPYEISYNTRPQLRESTSLLLSADSVSYPVTTTTSNLKNYEIDWMESRIPNSYLSTFAAPQLATIGKKFGRSIAVASSRGFCVLDRGSDFRTTNFAPKWRLFANESHEKQFRVVAFSWWEGPIKAKKQSKTNHELFDDIVVAVIEVIESRNDNGFYLSCWSVRNVELSAQLLTSTSRMDQSKSTAFKWGLKLPADFIPSCIDLLALPNLTSHDDSAESIAERLTTVIVNDCSLATNYLIYQLRLENNAVGTDFHNVIVRARCTAFGCIGSPAELFIASSSFTKERDDDEYTVIGVMQKQGIELDAILVGSSKTFCVGEIIASASPFSMELSRGDISLYWLADIVYDNVTASASDRSNSFEWIFQLADGRLVSWSIPFSFTINQWDGPFRNFDGLVSNGDASCVEQNSRILGIVTPAGTASSWMQQSTGGVQSNFRGGTVPFSAFGYAIGMSQSYKKIITTIGDNNDNDCFRPNVQHHTVFRPGELVLYPPSYLPSLHVQTAETIYNNDGYSASSYHLEKYVRTKIVAREQQDMAVLSLRLIVLRLCERLAKISQSHSSNVIAYSRVYDSLTNIVRIIRNCTNPLQFATFFITLGRQMEISCLHHLFPLPETPDDLYSIAASFGSIPTSVSTLPILSDKKATILKCTDMFHVCVDRLDGVFQPPLQIDFDVGNDEFYSVGEIFRYALKTHDNVPGINSFFGDESASDDADFTTRRSSILCGMTKIFGLWNTSSSTTVMNVPIVAKRKTGEIPLLIHGITESKIMKLHDYGVKHLRKLSQWQVHTNVDVFTNVPQVSARFVVSSIFGGSPLDSQLGWIKVALLSIVVMCDMSPENASYTVNTFSQYIETFKVSRFLALAPLDVRRDGMVTALDYFIRNCHDGIDPEVASCVFDLIVVLLGCDVTSFMADLPGLVLIAIVAAHRADRILDILSPESESALSISYFELRSKQAAW